MAHVSAPERRQLNVIAVLLGTATIDGASPIKARAWLLEEKQLILATSTPDFQINRSVFAVESATLGSKTATVFLTNGQRVDFRLKSCNCGMGILGAALPVDERFQIVRVVNPEWVESIK